MRKDNHTDTQRVGRSFPRIGLYGGPMPPTPTSKTCTGWGGRVDRRCDGPQINRESRLRNLSMTRVQTYRMASTRNFDLNIAAENQKTGDGGVSESECFDQATVFAT